MDGSGGSQVHSVAQPKVTDWSKGMQVPSVTTQQFPTEGWSAQLPLQTGL